MKILIFADLHIHSWNRFGVDELGMPHRLRDQVKVMDQIEALCKERAIKYVMFGGDPVHTVGQHPTEVIYFLQEFLKRLHLPMLMADGNHDEIKRVNTQDFHKVSSIFRGYCEFIKEIPGLTVRAISYHERPDWDTVKGYDIVIIHKQPALAMPNGHVMDGVAWPMLAENNRTVFFAHDHTPRELAPNCWVIGSTMQLDFGEDGDHGVMILDTDTWKVERIALKSPKFITVQTEDEVKDDYNFYKVLNPKSISTQSNVICVNKPQVFDERIKSAGQKEILLEWLELNKKPADYMAIIDDIFSGALQGEPKIFPGRLASVEAKNLFSIGHIKYDLEKGFTFITGRIKGAAGESNGAGKSSIVGETVLWVLTGETTKELEGDDVIREIPELQKEAMGKVTLKTADGKEVIIERSRVRKEATDLKVWVDGKDLAEGFRAPDRQRILETTLGITKDLFMASCYFSQEGLTMLTGFGDAERTNMITNLLGFNMYEDMYEKVDKRAKDYATKLEESQQDALRIEGKITLMENDRKNAETNKGDVVAQVVSYQRQLADLENQIMDLTKQRNVVPKIELHRDFDDEINKLSREKEALEQQEAKAHQEFQADGRWANRERKIQYLIDERRQAAQAKEKEIEPLVAEMATAAKHAAGTAGMSKVGESSIANVRAEIKRLENKEKGILCIECGNEITEASIQRGINQRLDKIKDIQKEIDGQLQESRRWADERLFLEEKIKKIREEARKLDNVSDLEADLMQIRKERDVEQAKLIQFKNEINAIKDKIYAVMTAKRDNENAMARALEKVQSIDQQIKGYQRMAVDINAKLKEFKELVERRQKEYERITKDILTEREALKTVLSTAQEHEASIERLDFWKFTFSPKGIRAVLLDGFCNQINVPASEYAAAVSNGAMTVFLSPMAETKKGEARNKIDIKITWDNYKRKYKSLSGGEKCRVDLVLCFALNKWVSQRYRLPQGLLGMIVFDELFSSLDKAGEELTAAVLTKEGEDKAIVVISHTQELLAYADRVWTAERDKNRVTGLITTT